MGEYMNKSIGWTTAAEGDLESLRALYLKHGIKMDGSRVNDSILIRAAVHYYAVHLQKKEEKVKNARK